MNGPVPTGFVKSVAVLHDPRVPVDEVGPEVGVGELERDPHGGRIDRLQAVQVDPGHERRRREVRGLRHEPDGVDEILGAEGLAVVELDARPQLHLVLGGVGVRVHLERQPWARREVGVLDEQRIEQVLHPRLVDRRHAGIGVQRLGRAAADEPGADRAAPDRLAAAGRGRPAAAAAAATAAGGREKRGHADHARGGTAQQGAARQAVAVGLGARGRVGVVRVGHRFLQIVAPAGSHRPLSHTRWTR
jgi:hypothetical protein